MSSTAYGICLSTWFLSALSRLSSVKRLRETHPDTPILLVEDSSFRNLTPTAKGRILRAIHKKLTEQEGIGNLYFLANQGMLGEDGEGTVDGCHPNDLGMMRQAAIFTGSLTRILQTSGL